MTRPIPPFENVKRVRASNSTLAKLHNLKTFLGCEEIVTFGQAEGFVTWGNKPQHNALMQNTLKIEDGFYRSVGLGKEGTPPISLIFDRVAPFATLPSIIEKIMQISDLKTQIITQRLTKYNTEHYEDVHLETNNAVIIDQVLGDKSILQAGATHETFFDMVCQAKQTGTKLYLKTHPDVLAEKAKGILTPHARDLGLELITGHPHAILRQAKAVYTVSSLMGFEAMLFGLSPHIYGQSFYKDQNIETLLEAMLNHYSHFVDPVLNRRITASEGLNRLASWRDLKQGLNKRYYCVGFKRWKRPFYKKILYQPQFPSLFGRGAKGMQCGEGLLQWGRAKNGTSLEDGFIRSKGLGSNFVPPSSLIFDERGIYYDATRLSDFEQLANTYICSTEELARAKILRERIIKMNLSKYNLGGESKQRAPYLLVLGQVANDKSLEFGTLSLKTNAELLNKARRENPNAYIIYKEHPDVSSGNRKGKITALEADEIVRTGDILPLIADATSVHTLTSLGGFEALIRGKEVHTYGLPFYAGWGLTHDLHNTARRQRTLTLDKLTFLALVKYPRYFDPVTGIPCEIEDTLTQLENGALPPTKFRFWRYIKAMMNG